MSALSDIQSYWSNNHSLNSYQLYTGLQPPGVSYPYVTIEQISSVPSWYTGLPYYESVGIQFNIFSTSLASCESLASTIMAQFDWAAVATATVSCMRMDYRILTEAGKDGSLDPTIIYHAVIVFDYLQEKQLA